MKANSVNIISASAKFQIKPVSFRSEGMVSCSSNANDEFVSQNKSQNKKPAKVKRKYHNKQDIILL
jgi:hypothetical protein